MNLKQELRHRYKETWGVEWPHGNAYLQTLWEEAKKAAGLPPKTKQNCGPAKELCLTAMRLDHHF